MSRSRFRVQGIVSRVKFSVLIVWGLCFGADHVGLGLTDKDAFIRW